MPNLGKEKIDNPKLIHYNLFFKPWHYDNITYEEYFWKYAKESIYYEEILNIKKNYSLDDKKKDREYLDNMLKRASMIAESSNNFRTVYESGKETRL